MFDEQSLRCTDELVGVGRGHVTRFAFFSCCTGDSEKDDGSFQMSSVEKRELEHLLGFLLPCSGPNTVWVRAPGESFGGTVGAGRMGEPVPIPVWLD